MKQPKLVVIGLGQEVRGDDGAGIRIVRDWRAKFPCTSEIPEVRVEISGLPGLDLLSLMEEAQAAILVDAVHEGSVPGRLYELNDEQVSAFSEGAQSAHGWGIAETLALAKTIQHKLPKRLAILAIGSNHFDLGANLSPQVEGAIPRAVEHLQEMVLEILGKTSGLEEYEVGVVLQIRPTPQVPGNPTLLIGK